MRDSALNGDNAAVDQPLASEDLSAMAFNNSKREDRLSANSAIVDLSIRLLRLAQTETLRHWSRLECAGFESRCQSFQYYRRGFCVIGAAVYTKKAKAAMVEIHQIEGDTPVSNRCDVRLAS